MDSDRCRRLKFPRRARLRNPVALILLGIAWFSFSAAQVFGQAPERTAANQYDIKAAFLYHFTRYLQWPEGAKPESFTIVVLGRSRIIAPLQEIAKTRSVGQMPILVRQCFKTDEIGHPRILFIAESATQDISEILEKTRGTDILTVGEAEGLGSRGVAINFILQSDSIKFEVNEKALKEAHIQAGSQLLRLAILIKAGDGRGGR